MIRSGFIAALTFMASFVPALALADIPPVQPQTPYDQGYEQGYAFGQAFGPLVCLCCTGFIALLVGLGIFFIVRKKKQKPE